MIPIIIPDVSFDEVADDIRIILESGRLTSGPYVARFERAVADYVGTKHAFATTSATTALQLSLMAAGIGAGDEVLVSDFTFPASGNAIIAAGATPVLVDCVAGGFEIDLEDAARKVTGKTQAIMPVDPFGQPADLAGIEALAATHDLVIVEDAACALGASRDGRRCGGLHSDRGSVGCFSFHPRKVITCGEGGAITTNDDWLAERITVLKNHGGVRAEVGMRFTDHGFNYRMSEIQAALGLSQLRRLHEILEDRRTTASRYMRALATMPGVTMPRSAEHQSCTYQSFVVMLDDSIDRDRTIMRMRELGVETTLGTYAMHAQPAFAHLGYAPGQLPAAWQADRQALTLPLLPRMTTADVDHVVSALHQTIAIHPANTRQSQSRARA